MNNGLDRVVLWYFIFFKHGIPDTQSLWPPSACVQHGQAMEEETPSTALSAVLNTLPRTPVYAVSRLPSLKRRVET
jgi:hypothetical protein